MLKQLIGSLAAVTALVAGPALAQEVKEINFGIISTDGSASLRKHWQPLFDDMEKAVGVKITPFFATDYAGIIEGMRFNKVQVAYYGNKSAMEAVDRANGEVFAKVIGTDGSEGYNSLLVTHKDSPYQSVEDVLKNSKSINFGIGDPNSTSGFLVPGYYLFAQNKVDPKTAFKTIRSANHTTNLLAAANKQVDVATFNTLDYEKMQQSQPEVLRNVRVLWKSPLIPADPFVWRKDLPADLKTKLKTFMVDYARKGTNTAEQKDKIKLIPASGFAASSNDQLVPIRQLALFSDRTKLEDNATMDPAEKAAKLAEINRKLAELGKQLAAN